ncbi:lipid A deacylase LpxR family protein [Teredinibacter turnerae]|uniref:lipid A deacylase LpxR family protein n=1 Tax=Teredinibacter turnerae TaxID=2426 RepID=UPI0005F809B8|nr:lipid A deacylase LpxR family protein [Teredinibacter turnerae]
MTVSISNKVPGIKRTLAGLGVLLMLATWVSHAAATNAVTPPAEQSARLSAADGRLLSERGRWYLSFDNDLFAPKNRDQDYTYGINFAYTSDSIGRQPLPELLAHLDDSLGLEGERRAKTLEFGLYGFTPANVESSEADQEDRPYASLVYVSTSSESMDWTNQVVLRSQLTLGVLGLDLVGNVQNLTHRTTNGTEAGGWSHQISDGGEPTFRYSLARQQLVETGLLHTELKHTLAASVGYLTEVSWSLGVRTGNISTTWHSFKPEVKNYAESLASQKSKTPENYFWAGLSVKARAYNAFLQGQFRESDVVYTYDELRPFVLEAWAGYTHEFASGYHINYGLRGHTSEIREGKGDRNVIWGGIMVGKSLI